MKKGFTLIELLSVIVIITVLSAIAVPTFLNIIEKSRESASKVSSNYYINALENKILEDQIKNNDVLVPNKAYFLLDYLEKEENEIVINDYLKIKGAKPDGADDYILFDNKYNIIDAMMTFNGYVIFYSNNKISGVSKIKDIVNPSSMTLNYTNETLEIGSKIQIEKYFTPVETTNKNVVYTSSNNNVVKVDSYGEVLAVGRGEATITATSKANKNIKSTITIKVISSTLEIDYLKDFTSNLDITLNYNDNKNIMYKVGTNAYVNYTTKINLTSDYIYNNSLYNVDKKIDFCVKGNDYFDVPFENCIIIDNIDLEKPAIPIITGATGNPYVTDTTVGKIGKATIDYGLDETTKKYYSFDNTNWVEYSGEFPLDTAAVIYAKNVRPSGFTSASTVNVSTHAQAVSSVAYDGLTTNYAQYCRINNTKYTQYVYLWFDPSSYGKTLTTTLSTTTAGNYTYTMYISVVNTSGTVISSMSNRSTFSFVIPENAAYISFRYYSMASPSIGPICMRFHEFSVS